ncbi:hypothetical protein [Labilibacter marinus]|uniref:hypothetical protein n=1 Tax=Labilibacter marinus TaxID=1477105 RepID=UPI00094F5F7F|nr:hypothetical protein [Labilibacter marinus]
MTIIEPKIRHDISEYNKALIAFTSLNQLLAELRTKELPSEIIDFINSKIKDFNALPDAGVDFRRHIVKMQSGIYNQLEKETGLVPKGFYKHRWLALGMVVFGLPMGIVIGPIIGNIGFMGVGLPIGLMIGAVLGAQKDKKALAEGKQLDIVM